MDLLETIDFESMSNFLSSEIQKKATDALEEGKAVFLPKSPFILNEQEKFFLNPDHVDPKSKNISYNFRNDQLKGALYQGREADQCKMMVKRYALFSKELLEHLFPSYAAHLIQGRTSFRPVEACGRVTSYKKDDTRIHVDAFPSNPVQGRRILRVFTNVNPSGKPRVWRLGEPFKEVVKKMAPRVRQPLPGLASLMKFFKITKEQRSLYDHYMLHMHNQMKGDDEYQKNVLQQEIQFPAGSSWIVFSDSVSHAAMSGQYLFEQTFYLNPAHMLDQEKAPVRVLEKFLNKVLV